MTDKVCNCVLNKKCTRWIKNIILLSLNNASFVISLPSSNYNFQIFPFVLTFFNGNFILVKSLEIFFSIGAFPCEQSFNLLLLVNRHSIWGFEGERKRLHKFGIQIRKKKNQNKRRKKKWRGCKRGGRFFFLLLFYCPHLWKRFCVIPAILYPSWRR